MARAAAIAGALDYDLVTGVGQPAQATVAQDRIVEQAELLVDGPVAGDDETGRPMQKIRQGGP